MVELILPLPPSENEIYRNLQGRGRCATQALVNWRQDIQYWMIKHRSEVQRARDWIAKRPNPLCLNISTAFVFHRKRIWTLEGQPKRLDASNRIKALHDALGLILGVDDKHFYSGSFEKMQCDRVEDQCTVVWISESKPNEYFKVSSIDH